MSGEPLAEAGAQRLRPLGKPLLPHEADRGQGGGAGERVAAEGRAVPPGRRLQPLVRQDRPHRHAARDRLGETENVRRNAVAIAGEHAAGAAEARLNLVEHEHRTGLVADASRRRQVVRAGGPHPSLSLHRLEDHGRRVLAHGRAQLLDAVEGHEREARHERLEGCPVVLLVRRAQGPERPPVEAAHRGDDPRPPRREARELDRRLHRLRPGIAEEGAREPGRRDRDEFGQEPRPDIVVEDPRTGHEHPSLLRQRFGDGRVGVADARHADAAHAIDVAATLVVPHAGALAPHDRDVALREHLERVRPFNLSRVHEFIR